MNSKNGQAAAFPVSLLASFDPDRNKSLLLLAAVLRPAVLLFRTCFKLIQFERKHFFLPDHRRTTPSRGQPRCPASEKWPLPRMIPLAPSSRSRATVPSPPQTPKHTPFSSPRPFCTSGDVLPLGQPGTGFEILSQAPFSPLVHFSLTVFLLLPDAEPVSVYPVW